MEVYNERMEPVENPDMSLGWIEETVRTIAHEAVPAIPAVWHYVTAAEYENGGRDVVKVIDVPGTEAKEAWEENIPIGIYHPYTREELEEIEAEKNRATPQEQLQKMEEAMISMTQTLAQLEANVRTMMAWLMQREA